MRQIGDVCARSIVQELGRERRNHVETKAADLQDFSLGAAMMCYNDGETKRGWKRGEHFQPLTGTNT